MATPSYSQATPGYHRATPSYGQVSSARKRWEESQSTTLPPVFPNPPSSSSSSKKHGPSDRFKQPSLQYVQAMQPSQPSSKQSLQTPASLPSGRRRTVSFDEMYFQHHMPLSNEEHHLSTLKSSFNHGGAATHAGTNFSRYLPSGHRWSDDGEKRGRRRSSTLTLPGVKPDRDISGGTHILHPAASLYKRGIYPYHNHQHPLGWQANTDSCSSLTSRSSGFSHYGRYHRARHRRTEEKNVRYENTYRMEPAVNFHSVEAAIQSTMEMYLEDALSALAQDEFASAADAANAAKRLSESVKHHIKLKRLPRYKIVTMATVCQRSGHDLISASQCVWDVSTDGFLAVSKQNKQWFGEIVVYAIYQE